MEGQGPRHRGGDPPSTCPMSQLLQLLPSLQIRVNLQLYYAMACAMVPVSCVGQRCKMDDAAPGQAVP